MGNCVFKAFKVVEVEEMIKVVTTDGGIMELYAPIAAECITNEFPGHALYRSRDHLFSKPLLHNEELDAGHLYYLLPLNTTSQSPNRQNPINTTKNLLTISSSSSLSTSSFCNSKPTPYRMSFDGQRMSKRLANFLKDGAAEMFPRYGSSTGVWKVKLVICPEQLAEILAQETRTEELIESVRTVAKCGNGVSSSSVVDSDQWSVSDSWKGSSLDKYFADAQLK